MTETMTIRRSIQRSFCKLTIFSGRDTRGEFWPYAAFVLANALFVFWIPSIFFSGLAFLPASLFFALMAAATTRRLHDRNKSALWALPASVFGVLGIGGFALAPWNRSNGIIPNTDYILMLFANNWLFLASLVVLIVILSKPGTPGPNRYDEPKRTDKWSRSS